MKSISIVIACLLVGGGGLALLGARFSTEDGPEGARRPVSQPRSAPSRLRAERTLVDDTGARTDDDVASSRDHERPRRPAPLTRTGASPRAVDNETGAGGSWSAGAPEAPTRGANTTKGSKTFMEASPSLDEAVSAARGQAATGALETTILVPGSAVDAGAAASIPAVLAEAVADSGLSEVELAGVASLAEEFIANVTGGSQDPQDPAHQRRWAEAQAESDVRMRAQYGGHAWLRHHMEVYRQALAESPTPPTPAE